MAPEPTPTREEIDMRSELEEPKRAEASPRPDASPPLDDIDAPPLTDPEDTKGG